MTPFFFGRWLALAGVSALPEERESTLAVIDCFPQEVSVLRIKHWAQELIREMEGQTENRPMLDLLRQGLGADVVDGFLEAVAAETEAGECVLPVSL